MLPTFNDTKGLGFSFRGRPFCIGTKTRDLRGLDVVFRGVPFAGALVEEADVEQTDCLVTAAPAAVSVIGHTAGCILAVSPPAVAVSIHGECSQAGTVYKDIGVEAPLGAVSLGGLFAGCLWIVSPMAGAVTANGECGKIGTVYNDIAIDAPPGAVSILGECPKAGTLYKDVVIEAPPGALAVFGQIAGRVLAFTPSAGAVAAAGQITGCGWAVPSMPGALAVVGSIAGCVRAVISKAGAVAVGGSITGITGWLALHTEPGRITSAGSGSALSVLVRATEPGRIVMTGTGIGTVITQRVLTPEPASIAVTGKIAFSAGLAILAEAQRRYECKLTADGQIPVVIPIAGFTSRQRAGEPSYSEVTLPGLDYLEQIMNRSTGSFTVSMLLVKAGITLQREVLFESPIDRITISGNDRKQNIVLSGNRPATENTGNQLIPLSGVTYRSFSNGMTTLRTAVPDIYLKPGDTVTYRNEAFVARTITYSFSSVGSFMEVREAEG